MFTGLVEAVGEVAAIREQPPGCRLEILAPTIAAGTALGDSVAINGCCLTVVANDGRQLAFEAGPETLHRTNLGRLRTGAPVNLERAMRLENRLGGHLVTGHIDGCGTLRERSEQPPWATLWFESPNPLTRQMASKGSIAVDGVSLTLVDVTDDGFSVALIPHTLSHTTLGRLRVGDVVNLETDLLAKYVQRQLEAQIGCLVKPTVTSPND
jgi:riboflavin synthase